MNMFKTLTDALFGRPQDSEPQPDPDTRRKATAYVGGEVFHGRVEDETDEVIIIDLTSAPEHVVDPTDPRMSFKRAEVWCDN